MVWLDYGREHPETATCVVEATAATVPRVIVTAGGEPARTVAVSWSDKRIRASEVCGRVERIERVRMETLAREMDRARAEVERARADVARASAEAERARAGFDRMRRNVERARVEAERRRR